ncbi:uncharacterized protein LOC141537946 [Cotesia typhae]|uniref:uncharacterized protein LOC141537946 n=1 Tax=Cotesia typhae TaxID=2053667 RepID=UPI003D69105B
MFTGYLFEGGSDEEEIRNPGEGTSREEPHPKYPPRSAGILHRCDSRSRPENVAGPSNLRFTVDSLIESSDQEEIMIPNTPESVINKHAHTNDNSDKNEDSLSFVNQLCYKLENLNPTSLYKNNRDSHAGPSNGNDNDNKNSQGGNVEASNTTREDINEDSRDSSQDFFCNKSISSLSQKTSSDAPEKSDQESLFEQSPHTHSNSENVTDSNNSDDIDIQERINDTINVAEDDNAVQRSWNERATSSERDDNGDQPQTSRAIESSFLMNYYSNPERELENESFFHCNVLEVKNFVNIFINSDYNITNPITPEHALTTYIRSPASSNHNISDPSDQTDGDFIDFQESNREIINVAQDDSTSQESLDETAATRERDTDSDRPPSPEVLGSPATSIISETPQTSEASVSPESSDTLRNSETSETSITPEPLYTPKSPDSSDHSDRDNINFQESSNKIINNAEDDNTSQENLDERTTTTERDDDIDQLGSSESTEEPHPLLTPRRRKLRSRSNKVFGPPDYSDSDSIDIQESSNEMINVAQKDDDRVLPGTSKAYKDSYQFKSKTSPLKRRMVDRNRSLQKSRNDTINEAKDDITNQENINEIATTRERNNDDSDQSVLTQLELDLKRRINDNPGLRSGLDNVAGPSGHSDYDNNNFLPSSNTMISIAQKDDNVGEENINERAIMIKCDTDNSYQPGASEDSKFDVPVLDDSTDSSSSSSSSSL